MPSNAVLKEKEAIVARISDLIKGASAGVIVEYKGLTVAQDTQLRSELRKAGVKYEVIKNTLLLRAAKENGLDALESVLKDTTAMAASMSDVTAAAKIINEFSKKNEQLKIKAGFVEGKVIDAKEVVALADLPPKEVLVARVLGGMNAPISGLVTVLNGNIRGLACVLNAIAEQKNN